MIINAIVNLFFINKKLLYTAYEFADDVGRYGVKAEV